MNSGKYGVLTRLGCDEFFEGGCASFSDAVEAMMDMWGRLPAHWRASIKRCGYLNRRGDNYMVAVGDYDEETGEAWETMTLAKAMEATEEDEEEEEE